MPEQHRENGLPPEGPESKESIRLRVIAVPAFGADKKERYLPPEEKTFAPNKILSYQAKKVAREQDIGTIFADHVVGVGEDYANEVRYPREGREYEPTLLWAKGLADLVREKGVNPSQTQVILVAASYHRPRCIMDLQGEGFNDIIADAELDKYGMEAFIAGDSSHIQTRFGVVSLLWESGLRTLKKMSPRLYERIVMSRKEI